MNEFMQRAKVGIGVGVVLIAMSPIPMLVHAMTHQPGHFVVDCAFMAVGIWWLTFNVRRLANGDK